MASLAGARAAILVAIVVIALEQPETARAEAELIDFHRTMLVDATRMRIFGKAIVGAVSPGDVVVDIGAGTGVLSFLAATAGAARVYAIEQGPVMELARELSERNGFGDRVTFLAGHSTEVELPEPADVVITETIGNAAVDEGILDWIIDARGRLLRPGGIVVPRRLRLWTAAVESWDDHAVVTDWSAPSLPFDFDKIRERAEEMLWWVDLHAKDVLSEPALVADIDLETVTDSDVTASGSLVTRRDGVLHGLVCWFDAEVGGGYWVDNQPPAQAPSWSQGFLARSEPIAVSAGQDLAWEISASENGQQWQWLVEPTR